MGCFWEEDVVFKKDTCYCNQNLNMLVLRGFEIKNIAKEVLVFQRDLLIQVSTLQLLILYIGWSKKRKHKKLPFLFFLD